MSRVVETGQWCEGCGWFESETEFEGDRCNACGCDEALHVPASVQVGS